jgi:hypothetical protein
MLLIGYSRPILIKIGIDIKFSENVFTVSPLFMRTERKTAARPENSEDFIFLLLKLQNLIYPSA